MNVVSIYLLCIAYIAGLLFVGFPAHWNSWLPEFLTVGMLILLGTGAIASFLLPKLWRMGPRSSTWFIAGMVGAIAGLYLQGRSPTYDTLMKSVPPEQQPIFPMIVDVQGYISNSPRLTRSQRVRFTLHITDIKSETDMQPATTIDPLQKNHAPLSPPPLAPDILTTITRNVYVTIPLLHGTGLYPGQTIALHGRLYRPESASVPGIFNFQKYLEHQGIFAGLTGNVTKVNSHLPTFQWQHPPSWHLHQRVSQLFGKPLWQIRQRIVQSFVHGLHSPAGPLLSGMVLGRKAVDIPYDISDSFTQAGLAHILAASGFHISLLLGLVLAIGRCLSPVHRLALGSLTLVSYLCLTGLQPSVCRAALMGVAVLLAAVGDSGRPRRVRSVGALLTIATILLIVTPQWIWDFGFQLSFLATLGLIISVPWLTKRFSWVPPTIATLITVPIAATFWTLPLLLQTLGTILPYSPLLNMITVIPITLISLAGMIIGAIALLSPSIGTILADFLYWPIQGLMAMVFWSNQLPGQSIALGSLSTGQLILIYGFYGAIAQSHTFADRLRHLHHFPIIGISLRMSRDSLHLCTRLFMGLLVTTTVLIPLIHTRYNTVQITLFGVRSHPHLVMIVQNRGQVGILNNSSEADVVHQLLPFLRHEGINHFHWAIAPHSSDFQSPGWQRLEQSIPIHHHYTLSPPISHHQYSAPKHYPFPLSVQTISPNASIQHFSLSPLSKTPTLLQLNLGEYVWLIMSDAISTPNHASQQQRVTPNPPFLTTFPPSHIWCWNSAQLSPQLQHLLPHQHPQDAVITTLLPDTPHNQSLRSIFDTLSVPLYIVTPDRAVQWTPHQGFSVTSPQDYDAILL